MTTCSHPHCDLPATQRVSVRRHERDYEPPWRPFRDAHGDEIYYGGSYEEDVGEEDLDEEDVGEEGLDEEGLDEEGLDEEGLDEEDLDEEDLDEEDLDEEDLDEEDLDEEDLDGRIAELALACVDLFNTGFAIGEFIRVWPGARSGDGETAVVLGEASLSRGGTPWVPIRYLTGALLGQSDHIALTHVAKLKATPKEKEVSHGSS